MPFEQQKEIFDYARNKGIEIFSTPFDFESVDFLIILLAFLWNWLFFW